MAGNTEPLSPRAKLAVTAGRAAAASAAWSSTVRTAAC